MADAYFFVCNFVDGLSDERSHLISRLHDTANLRYFYSEPRPAGSGWPKTYDSKINVKRTLLNRMKQVETSFEVGECYTMVTYVLTLKRNVKLMFYYPPKDSCKIFFSTDTPMRASDTVEIYRCRFQIELRFRDTKQNTGLYDCQARDLDWIDLHFNVSFYSIYAAKAFMIEHSLHFSMASPKSLMYNLYITRRIISLCGYRPHRSLNAQIIKELLFIAAPDA